MFFFNPCENVHSHKKTVQIAISFKNDTLTLFPLNRLWRFRIWKNNWEIWSSKIRISVNSDIFGLWLQRWYKILFYGKNVCWIRIWHLFLCKSDFWHRSRVFSDFFLLFYTRIEVFIYFCVYIFFYSHSLKKQIKKHVAVNN